VLVDRVSRIVWPPPAATRPDRGVAQLEASTVVPASLAVTFAFFADAANLERLTPPWLNFRILSSMPVEMREGVEIEYRIVLYGVPLPWRSRIDVWEPGVRFVDRQVVGPYRWWRHEHIFEPAPHGTSVVDRVEFVPRLPWISSRLVRRDVERIFAYRRDTLLQLFSGPGDR
jgi:ligand-binding SRPBCC domain-containing protein